MDYEIQKFISEKEDQYFDRKSARIKPRDIMKHIVAFANADGGKLVIGIEDDGTISGFKFQGAIDPWICVNKVDAFIESFLNQSTLELCYETRKSSYGGIYDNDF